MNFHPELFAELLPYMGTGMLGIFIVMGVIIAITAILNRLTKKCPTLPRSVLQPSLAEFHNPQMAK